MRAISRRATLGSLGALAISADLARPARADDTPKRGGVLNVGFDDDAKTLDPMFSIQLSERQILYLVFNTLLAADTDFSIKPELARSWTVENDGKRYVFTLQEGVVFHDGTPFDAEAVKWNIDQRMDEKVASPQRSQLRPIIQSVEVVGPHVVALNLTAPYPGLLSFFTERPGFMVSPTAAQKYGKDFGRNPVGTGAFVFKEWNQGTSIVLARNPSYWQPGRPYLDGVVFRDIPNHVIGLQRLIVGEVDYVNSVSPDELRQVEGNNDLDVAKAKIGRWFSLQYQVDKPPFNNPKLRQAIAHALNRDRINQVTMRGQATLANGPTPDGLWWSSPDKIVYGYDPEKAKALLKEAGIAPGTQIALSAPGDVLQRKIDQLVAEQLTAIGLQVRLEPVSSSDAYARVVQRAINFTPISWTQRSDPDGLLYILFHSKGFANTTGYSNPQVDQMLEEARGTVDQPRRQALYATIKDTIQSDIPYISLYFAAEYAVLSKKIAGFAWIPDQIPRFRDLWRTAS